VIQCRLARLGLPPVIHIAATQPTEGQYFVNKNRPTLEQWRRAYELAAQIQELAPWTWMEDVHNFGFEDPQSHEQLFVTVMGRLSEHFAVAAYRGATAVLDVIEAIQIPNAISEVLIEVPQVHVSFEDREFLAPEDRRTIKELGLRFRGKHAWPCFRSYAPGLYPWHIDAEEVRVLMLTMEQVLAVAPRFKARPDELERLSRLGQQEHTFLMRLPVGAAENVTWEEKTLKLERPDTPRPVLEIDLALLKRAASFPRVENRIEVDVRSTQSPVQDAPGKRPYFPYIVLVVEASLGHILGQELLSPVPTLAAVHGKAPQVLLATLAQHEVRPSAVLVRSERLATTFRGVCDALDIPVTVQPTLPGAEEALTSIRRFLGGQG
jgi:hypothetical protein